MIVAARGAAAAPAAELAYRWVAAGNNGNLKTSDSTTAASWTTRTSSFGSSQIYSVASNGVNLYVATGHDGKLATSTDGITWTQQTSSFGTTPILAVAYGSDGYWVAVGEAGKIATSTDGTTWTQRTSGVASDLYAVAYGAGLWAVAGETSVLRTATDPTSTYTARTSTLTNTFYNALYYAPSQAIWVAGTDAGTTGALASSPDGITWTARNSAFSVGGLFTAFQSNSSVIVCGNTVTISPLVCDVQSSTNGTTWTNRTPATTAAYIQSSASDETGFMIMVGDRVQSTSDGTTWTDRGALGFNAIGCCHSSGTPSIR